MATSPPTSLSQALDFQPSSGPSTTLQLPSDIGIGNVTIGGYIACVMAKYALHYARHHPKMQHQVDLRSAVVQFYRPVFPTKPMTMTLREVSIGKGWSTLRVESFQCDKLTTSGDLVLTNFSIEGVTLQTGWRPSPEPKPIDLTKLETDSHPDWISYHCAFYPDGFRRGHSYAKAFIPRTPRRVDTFVEQWIEPGWDCHPQGSLVRKGTGTDTYARWTNEMIQFIVEMPLPVQENLFPPIDDKPSTGSIAATLEFAEQQQRAREEGREDWRALEEDGSKTLKARMVNVSLTLSTEIKQRLPSEGVRWLYLRNECKRILNGRMDMEVLLFDEKMDLIAIIVTVVNPRSGFISGSYNLRSFYSDGTLNLNLKWIDRLFSQTPYHDWKDAVNCKSRGSWNLHSVLPRGMDFFILLSSASGLAGIKGQANYDAGNTYEDALARYRVSQGEKATALDLGAMVDDGILAEDPSLLRRVLAYGTLEPITRAKFYGILDYCCDPARESVTPREAQIALGLGTDRGDGLESIDYQRQPMLQQLMLAGNRQQVGAGAGVGSGGAQHAISDREQIAASASLEEAAQIAAEAIIKKLAKSLITMQDGSSVERDRPLSVLGVDSLLGIELRNWIVKQFKVDLAVFETQGAATLETLSLLVAQRCTKGRGGG
ncbi:PKS-like enzyme [Aspergillus flavus]|nr:PKS-like enzyme [Aspergillus flavus]